MSRPVTLKNISGTGAPLEATYLPDQGMNLISYKCGGVEVIDQATQNLFDERFAGLGALIGPHFHSRKEIPHDFDESLFPHIARGKAKGRKEPFSHGIARYVPWKTVESDTQIKAKLKGSDLYKGTALSVFEGQDFEMTYEARLLSTGLFIQYKVQSEKPSVIGLHYYYALRGEGTVLGEVNPTYRDGAEWKPLPPEWTQGKESHLHFPLPTTADFGFIPEKKTVNDHDYQVILNTDSYSLHLNFNTSSDKEFSYQIFHPEGATYVCIEPISARQPPEPTLTSNTLETKLQIFPSLEK